MNARGQTTAIIRCNRGFRVERVTSELAIFHARCRKTAAGSIDEKSNFGTHSGVIDAALMPGPVIAGGRNFPEKTVARTRMADRNRRCTGDAVGIAGSAADAFQLCEDV